MTNKFGYITLNTGALDAPNISTLKRYIEQICV